MALFDPNTLAWNGKEVQDSSMAVFESAFAPDAVEGLINIVTGIKAKQQIAIIGRMNGLLGLGSGACDVAGRTVSIGMGQKLWDPEFITDKLKYCWTDLKNTFWIWGTKNGLNKYDLTGTDFMIFIEELLKVELWETWMRFAYFGDKAAALVSGGGVITNVTNGAATPIAAFNRIDGFWKQVFTIVSADATKLTAGLDTRNAGASYVLQAFTAADTTNRVVTNTLQNMWYAADSRLTSNPAAAIEVTKSVWDQYQRELTDANYAFTTERSEFGMETLTAHGITVKKIEFWDRIIREYMNNGTKWYLPHRALLVIPENMQVGTEEEGNFSEYDVFYDKVSKNVFVEFAFNIDAKIVLDYLIQAAY